MHFLLVVGDDPHLLLSTLRSYEVRKEKKYHQSILSRVMVFHTYMVDLAKRDEVNLKVKKKMEKHF